MRDIKPAIRTTVNISMSKGSVNLDNVYSDTMSQLRKKKRTIETDSLAARDYALLECS